MEGRKFNQISTNKECIKKLFSPKNICQGINKLKYYIENFVFNYLNFKIWLSTKSWNVFGFKVC